MRREDKPTKPYRVYWHYPDMWDNSTAGVTGDTVEELREYVREEFERGTRYDYAKIVRTDTLSTVERVDKGIVAV